MNIIQIKKLNDLSVIPSKGSNKAAGYDLISIEDYILMPLERKLFKTGLSLSIPIGMYGRIAPRSGLAYKDGIDVLAGVIDEDYRGEIGVILINFGKTEKQFKIGDKIAQIIFEFYNNINFNIVNELTETLRGEEGFGSTDNVIKIKDPMLKGETLTIKDGIPAIINKEESKITYESKLDLLEQWKKFGGTNETPIGYESLIREREKNNQQ